MAIAVGIKLGMTRVPTPEGAFIPVTVIQLDGKISQIKTLETDAYCAVQVAARPQHAQRLSKAEAGHLKKAGVEARSCLVEFRLDEALLEKYPLGSDLKADQFKEGQTVDVRGVTKGKGFQGPVKRHNFGMQDATHGNSLSHRAHGSVGQCQFPGRVFKGKKMAGHMGHVNRTAQHLAVVRVDEARNLLLVKGAIPGSKNGIVTVVLSTKEGGA